MSSGMWMIALGGGDPHRAEMRRSGWRRSSALALGGPTRSGAAVANRLAGLGDVVATIRGQSS